MGICTSCDSTSVATAKLVLQDGRLLEFPYPIKVSSVLHKNPNVFICNSDEMEFDNIVSPMTGDEELELGQLYFALPLNRLRSPLSLEEMGALAVKASAALANTGADKCGCRRKPLAFSVSKVRTKSSRVADDGGVPPRRRRSGGGGKGREFATKLSAIPE